MWKYSNQGETYLTAFETSPGFLNRSLLEPCGLFKSLMPAANLDAEPGVDKSAEDKGVPVINCYQNIDKFVNKQGKTNE